MSRPKFDETASIFELPVPAPLSVYVVIRPKPAAETLGQGILVAANRTKKADLSLRTVGEVVAMGAQAFKAGTNHLDPTQDPAAQQIKVGSWVGYRQHSGQKIRVKKLGETKDSVPEYLVIVLDTDIMYTFKDGDDAALFYDWQD